MAQLNGRDVSAAELLGLALTGYGHFTTMRVDDSKVRGLSLHLERLRRDARAVFDVELDTDLVRRLVKHYVRDGGSVIVRVTVFDPELDVVNPASASRPQILLTSRASPEAALPGMRVQPVEYARSEPHLKHIALFDAIRLRRQAQVHGFDDAVFTSDGYISEGATWNIGFMRDSTVVWPDAPSLPGVTVTLLDSAWEANSVSAINLAAVGEYQAAFATNAVAGVRPITQIGGVGLAASLAAVKQLQEAYCAIEPEVL